MLDPYYNYIKALHLIFVITWFAGLFYIPRLFIYHIEAHQKGSPEREILVKQMKLMAKRLWYIITWPSAILATFFALLLLYIIPSWLLQDWMHIKLFFVALLFFTTTKPTAFLRLSNKMKLCILPFLCAFGTKGRPSFYSLLSFSLS